MTAPEAPSSSSRSGARTSSTPAKIAGRVKSQNATITDRLRSARPTARIPALGSAGIPGMLQAQAASPAASTATPLNTIFGLSSVARPPRAGPSSTPTIAAPSAEPITVPRWSAGDALTSQARPPAHEQAPPTPCAKRAMSSRSTLWAKPNTRLVTASNASPRSTVGLTPTRAASQPAGSDPTSVPAG